MKLKNKFFALLLTVCGFNAYCQNVFVSVEGENLKSKNIRLSYIADRISLLEKPLYNVVLDSITTHKDFEATLDGAKEMILKVDMREYHFLTTPGNRYKIVVEAYNDSIFKFDYKEVLPCSLTSESDIINAAIYDVDTVIDEFLRQNHRMLFLKDSLTKANFYTIEKNLTDKYKDNEYINKYIKYEFASVKYGLYLESRKDIKDSLFAHQPILYDNIGYMDCLNTIFLHYFTKGYKFIKRKDIDFWLQTNNYNAFNDALGRDKVLENEVFREVVFLLGMKDAYMEGYFSRQLILNMIKKFANQTKFPVHKEIADNLYKYLSTRDFSGKSIRDFEVKDINSEIVPISKYMDKPLVLCFVQLNSIVSLKELETIHYCYDSIKNNCNIVTICCDNSFENMYNFIKNNKVGNKYQWPFVYFNLNWELMEEYQIHFFPTFVLLNQDGTIGKNPMESPSEGGLLRFYNKQENNKQ